MKNLFLAVLLLLNYSSFCQVHVKGYTNSKGTYVAPHQRSTPDGNPYNNYSFPGNVNPHTGRVAAGNPDTYLENYYNRKGNHTTNSSSSNQNSSYSSGNSSINQNLNYDYSGSIPGIYNTPSTPYVDPKSLIPPIPTFNDITIDSDGQVFYSPEMYSLLTEQYKKQVSYNETHYYELLYNIEYILFHLGYLNKTAVDGFINFSTIQALISFQKDHGLNPDGYLGKKTLNALASYLK